MLKLFIFAPVLSNDSAEIAQLVEHNLAKVGVASSSLVFRSNGCSNGGIGRHEGLKIPWPLRLCGFKSRFEYDMLYVTPCKITACKEFFSLCTKHSIDQVILELSYLYSTSYS